MFVIERNRSHLNVAPNLISANLTLNAGYLAWHTCWLSVLGNLYSNYCMDKKIKKKTWTLKRIATGGAIALFVGFVIYQFFFTDRRSKLKIDKDKITISTVEMGVFQDRIPNTGIVEPLRSVFLDAVEGG